VDCNIEIGSVSEVGIVSRQVMMRCPLITCGARISAVSTVFLYPRSAKPLKRLGPPRSPDTQLKLGVNEKPAPKNAGFLSCKKTLNGEKC
jgi:hypothetical protein